MRIFNNRYFMEKKNRPFSISYLKSANNKLANRILLVDLYAELCILTFLFEAFSSKLLKEVDI